MPRRRREVVQRAASVRLRPNKRPSVAALAGAIAVLAAPRARSGTSALAATAHTSLRRRGAARRAPAIGAHEAEVVERVGLGGLVGHVGGESAAALSRKLL